MKYKNDASFVFSYELYMFEQQATINLNKDGVRPFGRALCVDTKRAQGLRLGSQRVDELA
jgi:hypothetical protein